MRIYAYASGRNNDPELSKIKEQFESIQPYELIIENYTSGSKNRTKLDIVASDLRGGDKLVFFSLESTGRTARQLISLINTLNDRGVEIEVLKEGWRTFGEKGGVIADFCKELIKTDSRLKKLSIRDGLSKSKKNPGRPEGSYNKRNAEIAALLYMQKRPISEIMKSAGIKSRKTLYEYLDAEGVKLRSKRKL